MEVHAKYYVGKLHGYIISYSIHVKLVASKG
jgi:hypothetical protein